MRIHTTEEFEMWAFGSLGFDAEIDRMHAWNRLHGDLLVLHEDGDLFFDINMMKEIHKIMKDNPEGIYLHVMALKNIIDELEEKIRDRAISCEFDQLTRDHPIE